jgi:hypothetical protein
VQGSRFQVNSEGLVPRQPSTEGCHAHALLPWA